MSNVLPWLFLGLSGLFLLTALLALWQSLRAAFGVTSLAQARAVVESEERVTLLDEKASLLHSLRDLELDRDSDKISDPDYRRLQRQLRNRARGVLKMLDEDVKAYRPEAEQLVAGRLSDQGLSPYRSSSAPTSEEPEEETAREEPDAEGASAGESLDAAPGKLACPECEIENDEDAVFCKKCGTRLSEAGEGAS